MDKKEIQKIKRINHEKFMIRIHEVSNGIDGSHQVTVLQLGDGRGMNRWEPRCNHKGILLQDGCIAGRDFYRVGISTE